MNFAQLFKPTFLYLLTFLNIGLLLIIFIKSDNIMTSQLFTNSRLPERISYYETVSLDQSENFEKLKNMTFDVAERKNLKEIIEIVYYNVSKPIPIEANSIECIVLSKANPPYNVCLHDNDKDRFLSGSLRKDLAWETGIQDMIKSFFLAHRNATFVDLGSNIGVHSLYAATVKNDVQVLAVEPFPKNVIRIHKAAQLNKADSRFKVVMAPVSNKRGPVTFYEIAGNIGGNGILIKPSEVGSPGFTSKSIIFDDLTSFVDRKIAFLKMDIEAAECHVFSNAHRFFQEIDVKFIVMEILYTKQEGACCFEGMLKFLKERNYKGFTFPYQLNKTNPLDFDQWRNWNHGDMYFEKF